MGNRTSHCPSPPLPDHPDFRCSGYSSDDTRGLWGLDQLKDLFQRLWSEKWQLSINPEPLRKQSHPIDSAVCISVWVACSVRNGSSSHRKHSFISIDIPWTGNGYRWQHEFCQLLAPFFFFFYFKQYYCSVDDVVASLLSSLLGEKWRNSEHMGCSVSPREKWQVQMGVCVLSAWISFSTSS